MTETTRSAVLELIRRMNDKGGKCTFEHVLAACQLLQSKHAVPLGLEYILRRYRPYSSDLDEEIARLRRIGLLELRSERNGHGVPLDVLTTRGELELDLPEGWEEELEDTAAVVASMSTLDALVFSTILYLALSHPNATEREVIDSVLRVTAGVDREEVREVFDRFGSLATSSPLHT